LSAAINTEVFLGVENLCFEIYENDHLALV